MTFRLVTVTLCILAPVGVGGCAGTTSQPEGNTQPVPTQAASVPSPIIRLHLTRTSATTPGSTFTIAGSVSPSTARVVISPDVGEDVIVHAVAGAFRARVPVSVGENQFQVTAQKSGYATSRPQTVSVTRTRPRPKPTPRTTSQPSSRPDCDPNYAGACVPIASDVDCAGGSGNGPAYVQGPVRVVGTDIYDLDRDGDGVGCDTAGG